MSEKRFTFGAVSPNVAMIKDNGEPMNIGEVVSCLNEQQAIIKHLTIEKHQADKRFQTIIAELKKENGELNDEVNDYIKLYKSSIAENEQLKEENSNLNSVLNEVGLQKPFIKILDDYMIEYDGSCFSMHKPSDIRSFVYLMNRNNNFDELQCEYNDESMVIDDE